MIGSFRHSADYRVDVLTLDDDGEANGPNGKRPARADLAVLGRIGGENSGLVQCQSHERNAIT